MEKFIRHRIKRGGTYHETLEFFEGSFFEAQCRIFELASKLNAVLYLWTYSGTHGKWIKMGEYKPDLTAKDIIGKDWRGDILGEAKRFTFDPNNPWEKIIQ